ncbi:insulinase family protein [Chryseobacterium indoltheticum]|uniref:insulinase family protein n=1 Tax=Chryseobacterium indoltheticum TaxID=254 RepID=UPI003F4905FD
MSLKQKNLSTKISKLADVQNVYKKYYAPDNAYLVTVGDVKFDKVKPMVEKAFNNWKKADTKIPSFRNLLQM